jgi:hypothetical protein
MYLFVTPHHTSTLMLFHFIFRVMFALRLCCIELLITIMIIIIQLFTIYVPSQQLKGQLQTQHSADTSNYIMEQYNIKPKRNYRQALEKIYINKGKDIPVTGRGGPKGCEVKAPTLLRQTANRWQQGCQPYAPAALYPQGFFIFFYFIFLFFYFFIIKIPGTHFG